MFDSCGAETHRKRGKKMGKHTEGGTERGGRHTEEIQKDGKTYRRDTERRENIQKEVQKEGKKTILTHIPLSTQSLSVSLSVCMYVCLSTIFISLKLKIFRWLINGSLRIFFEEYMEYIFY